MRISSGLTTSQTTYPPLVVVWLLWVVTGLTWRAALMKRCTGGLGPFLLWTCEWDRICICLFVDGFWGTGTCLPVQPAHMDWIVAGHKPGKRLTAFVVTKHELHIAGFGMFCACLQRTMCTSILDFFLHLSIRAPFHRDCIACLCDGCSSMSCLFGPPTLSSCCFCLSSTLASGSIGLVWAR
jgi:hypothetical protein